ncbi:DUF1566 domain-containing protein [Trichlorobacter lovleyi]|uniref:Lcl C-terminal domain-containing protein n=1 Tax=Trichlorobacter lovleyi TaxID=313985 RepID=UPI003D0CBCBF
MHTKHRLFLFFLFTILNSPFFIPNSAQAGLPDTGQTKCYNSGGTEIPCAGTGQDGAYSINPMSFADNGNGTITDNNTGLTWQKCSMGQNNDATCSGSAVTYNWYQASGTYDASYNPSTISVCGSLSLAGSGWRLPTKKELMGIVDYSIPSPGPTIQQAIFPNTVSAFYWASPTITGNTNLVWYVHFGYGGVVFGSKSYTYYVRCVRG